MKLNLSNNETLKQVQGDMYMFVRNDMNVQGDMGAVFVMLNSVQHLMRRPRTKFGMTWMFKDDVDVGIVTLNSFWDLFIYEIPRKTGF